jgi:hypothetical protein
MPDNIDISEQLREQREWYVKLHERAAHISENYPDTDLGAEMAGQCKLSDLAIASVDQALQMPKK